MCVCVCAHTHVIIHLVVSDFFVIPWTAALQAPLSMEFSR